MKPTGAQIAQAPDLSLFTRRQDEAEILHGSDI